MFPNQRLKRAIHILLLTWCWLTPNAWADDLNPENKANVADHDDVSRLRLYLAPGYFMFSRDDVSASGFSAAGGIHYGITERWGIAAGYRQAYSSQEQFTSLFSQIDFRASYAIFGSQVLHRNTTRLNDWKVAEYSMHNAGGLIAEAAISQYYFSGSTSVVSFSGPGLGLRYEFPSASLHNWVVGARFDRVTNSRYVLYSYELLGGIYLWL